MRALSLCLLLLVVACGSEPPEWVALAHEGAAEVSSSSSAFFVGEGRRIERQSDSRGRWLAVQLERADWTFAPRTRAGVWSAPIAVTPRGRAADGVEAELEGFRYAPQSNDASVPWRFSAGCFATLPGRLLLKLEDGERPPERVTLRVFAGPSREPRDGEPWRLAGRRFSGDGFDLTTGESVRVSLPVADGAELRFATLVEPCFGPPTAPREAARFVVLVDGVERLRHEEVELGEPRLARHVVALDPGVHDIELRVEGGFVYGGFLAPRIGPREVGAAGERPWGEARPDLIVFLADTLRADALEAYGGTLGVTPHLDAFARESRVYRRAWSTGTYTLPAHASMFTGAFPHQVGIVGTDNGVPQSFTTIAEELQRAGYRTVAITDSVVVTNALGLAQGFEWFDELHANLGSTLARSREALDDDDGRPLFLFVHTYRAHLPYRASKATRAAWGERLGLEGDPDELRARIQRLVESPPETPDRQARITAALQRLEAFYWAGVVDLDAGFRRFLDDLEERGLRDHAQLVFASDHGEAFGEHGAIYHRDKVWDVLARIPLVIDGPDVPPGVIEHAASLVDLPRTLADWAGIAPRPEWSGQSLLDLALDRPAFVFECRNHPDSTLAVIEGAHKLIGFEREGRRAGGEFLGAFDLDEDPSEEQNLLGGTAALEWPRDLQRRMVPVLEALLVPLSDPERAALSADRLDELRAMGYGGDG